MIQRPRGTADRLPDVAPAWRLVTETFQRECELRGFAPISTPTIERTELFARTTGDATDLAQKEMYSFEDRGGDSLTLRSEGTAPVVRAYVQNGLHNRASVSKPFCIGPMFRYERPQAGRLRQFHQIDAEVLGSVDPAVDAELLVMLMEYLDAMGVEGLALQINNLGDAECRPAYAAALKEFLREETRHLGTEIAERVERNPLRFLDSKDPDHQEIITRAPRIDAFWNDACREHLEGVCRLLESAGVAYEINPRLVRGLDY